MREHRSAADIARRPHSANIGGQRFIDEDNAAVDSHADAFETQVIRVRLSSGGHEKVTAGDVAFSLHLNADSASPRLDALDVRVEMKLDSFALQKILQSVGDVDVFRLGNP